MNQNIRNLIDEIFAEMKMSAENLALRDELMANAQAHYEDEIARGRTEEEALREVADSLGDVHALLRQMNEGAEKAEAPSPKKEKPAPFWSAMEQETPAQEAKQPEQPRGADSIEGTIGKAMDALGDFGRQIMPQTRRFVRRADEATGGMLSDFGKTIGKGVRDMTKAAGETFDWVTRPKEEQPQTKQSAAVPEETPEALRKRAGDIRAQAELKQAVGDQEGARDMRREAYEMETRADELEQEEALRAAQAAAQAEGSHEEAAPGRTETDEADHPAHAEWLGDDGAVDGETFKKTADALADEAEEAIREAGDPGFRVEDAPEGMRLMRRYAAAGLQRIEIELDSDDVEIIPGGEEIQVTWEAGEAGEDSPECSLQEHALTVRRRSPDLVKSFFSVFSKSGGKVTVCVPKGYAAAYAVRTTSGDVYVGDVDADEIEVNSTSGSVRMTPDAGHRAERLSVNTVSGDVTISACAQDIHAKTVSGALFISCDASRVDANTVSGKAHIEGACDTWDVSTVSGEAELLCTAVPVGKISINTLSAQAHVALPAGIRGFIAEASGPNTAIVNEFGPNRYGTCALPIRLETLSGKLILTRL